MNIHGVFDMAPNSSLLTTSAAVKRTNTEFFRFNPDNYPGTTLVNVTRDSAGVWTVTADSPAVAALVKSKTLGTVTTCRSN